jgi:hypothetical protein
MHKTARKAAPASPASCLSCLIWKRPLSTPSNTRHLHLEIRILRPKAAKILAVKRTRGLEEGMRCAEKARMSVFACFSRVWLKVWRKRKASAGDQVCLCMSLYMSATRLLKSITAVANHAYTWLETDMYLTNNLYLYCLRQHHSLINKSASTRTAPHADSAHFSMAKGMCSLFDKIEAIVVPMCKAVGGFTDPCVVH